MKKLLIIFIKNPELGQVKSRLAKSIGDEKALSVYKKLLIHTKKVVFNLNMDIRICYSKSIMEDDIWSADLFQKALQTGIDLGSRMQNAIVAGFEDGYTKICIIGSDLLELDERTIYDAFESLSKNDIVIGPAKDGGYYLIGMKSLHCDLFEDKIWGTETVLADTIYNIKELKLSYELLQVLNDIDELEDINPQDMEYLLS